MKDNLRMFKQKEGPKPGVGQQANGPIRVNADDLENLRCIKCGGELWDQAINMKIVPMTVSPTGKEEVSPAPVIFCMDCKEPVETTIEKMKK